MGSSGKLVQGQAGESGPSLKRAQLLVMPRSGFDDLCPLMILHKVKTSHIYGEQILRF